MERRKVAVWTGLVATGLVVASCLVMAGNVTADLGPETVEQGFKPQSEFQNPEEFRSSQGNNPGDANLPGGIDAKPGQVTAEQAKPSGIKAWFADHAKGLGLGLLEGVGIGLGVVALGALGVLAAPVVGIAAIGAVAGCAIYGAMTGANKFNPWECAVNGVIGAVSAGLGSTVAAGSKLLTTVVNSVGGGIASTAGYLLNDPNPTFRGAMAAFGIGAGTAGLMTIGGEWLSKTQVYQKAANLLHIGTKATKAASAVGNSLDDASTRSIGSDGASMASEAVEATGTARSEVAERLGNLADESSAVVAKATTSDGTGQLPTAPDRLGGAYRDVPKNGGQNHHMPANSVSPYGRDSGPVINMSTEDHMQTASWGRSKEAQAYRAQQQELIQSGHFVEAQDMDIADVRGLFGSKYDEAIQQMREYTLGLLSQTKQ